MSSPKNQSQKNKSAPSDSKQTKPTDDQMPQNGKDAQTGQPEYLYQLTQTRYGPMLANPNDVFIGVNLIKFGEYSHEEWLMIEQLINCTPAGSITIEVGANCGSHSVPMAKLLNDRESGLIVYEPQPVVFQQLCANFALNGILNAAAYPVACGETQSRLFVPTQNYYGLGNFGGVSMSKTEVSNGMPVECVTLDEHLSRLGVEKTVGLIKIDVEGFEEFVLKGAKNIIKKDAPIIYVEADRLEETESMMAWLRAQNYKMWWHTPLLLNPDNFNKEDIKQAGQNIVSLNLICVHQSREFSVEGLVEVTHDLAHEMIYTSTGRLEEFKTKQAKFSK